MNLSSGNKMSIQTGLYGLSFFLQHDGKEIFRSIPFESEVPSGLNEIIEKIHDEQLKRFPVSKITILHHNNLNTIVPEEMLDDEKLPDLLKYNIKLLPGDTLETDRNLPSGTANVYVPYENINNFFIEQYGEIEYFHSATPFLKYARQLHKKSRTEIFVRPGRKDFQMAIFRQGEFYFFNTFPMHHPDDFLYYFFFVWEEKELTPLRPHIHILSHDDIHKELKDNILHFTKRVTYHPDAEKEILKHVL